MGLSPNLTHRYLVKRHSFSQATIATHVVGAAVVGKRLVVVNFNLRCLTTAQTLQWKSAANNISGLMTFVTGELDYGPMVDDDYGILETAVGEALGLALGAATQVSGHITYLEV